MVVGECLHVDEAADRSHRIDCAGPAAGHRVVDRHEGDDLICPPEATGAFPLTSRVTPGTTICLVGH